MRRLIITLLVLGGLLVAADFGAAALTESAVSREMRAQIGLADDPDVRINGFPFLTQAISGRYGSVDVRAQRLRVGDLQDLEVNAQLRDVVAPLSMLWGSSPVTLRAGEVEASVLVPAEDLERLINRNGALTFENVRIDPIDEAGLETAAEEGGDPSLAAIDPDRAARLTATTTLPLLGEGDVSVIAALQLSNGRVRLVARDVRYNGDPLPAAVRRTVEQLFTLSLEPGSLPLQLTPSELRAVGGALLVSGVAEDLALGAGAAPTG